MRFSINSTLGIAGIFDVASYYGLKKLDKEATIPLAFIHGDFISWNIKEKENKELCLYDWEYSKKFGLPF